MSDDTPVLGQPSISVFTARGFVPYSLEVEQDYAGFQNEMARLLAEGYNELIADKLVRGSGNGEPKGYITALDAVTASEVRLTTAGAFGDVDIYKVWKNVPERFRSNASWIMSVDVNNRIRHMGTANNTFHAYTVALPAGAADQLMNRPVFTSSYFPDFTGTTGTANVRDDLEHPLLHRVGARLRRIHHPLRLARLPQQRPVQNPHDHQPRLALLARHRNEPLRIGRHPPTRIQLHQLAQHIGDEPLPPSQRHTHQPGGHSPLRGLWRLSASRLVRCSWGQRLRSAPNILTVGDLNAGYTVARRAGMSIEIVPLLMGTTSNRPTGERGFFAWARVGGGTTVDAAGRLLNQT